MKPAGIFGLILAALLLLQSGAAAQQSAAAFSVEDYGLLPKIRSLSIAPDGGHYAYIYRQGEDDMFVVYDIAAKKIAHAIPSGNIKARSVYFATNNRIVLHGSRTMRRVGIRGQWEHSGAYVYEMDTKRIRLLLNRHPKIHPAQEGLGEIAAFNRPEKQLYMPAFYGGERSRKPPRHLMRVNVETGSTRIHAKGKSGTRDWFVDAEGKVLAREDYLEQSEKHRILSKLSGDWKEVYALETDVPEIGVAAIGAQGRTLIIVDAKDDNEAIYSLSLEDGKIEGPLYQREDSDVDAIFTQTLNRTFIGLRYSGLIPTNEYQNPELTARYAALQKHFPESTLNVVSATEDFSRAIVKVSGNQGAEDYHLYDGKTHSLVKLASGYPNVKAEQIAQVEAFHYQSEDGLEIPSVITWPVGITERSKLPLLVFPHGGPAAYDSIRFNWWAQYFARRGYLVLQPNFRGSTGFGIKFRNAGEKEWGRKMQSDLTDGVNALVKAGSADPERVCIMGASYGGYAALAGGAFTPNLYRCIIAVNGVSDLPDMLRYVTRRAGRDHWVTNYWKRTVGDSKEEREKLKELSPARFADDFSAPVLLLHGKDDTVVPLSQSRKMQKALEKAGKTVEMVTLKSEDHWLSKSPSRLQTLREIDGFLQQHNPPN